MALLIGGSVSFKVIDWKACLPVPSSMHWLLPWLQSWVVQAWVGLGLVACSHLDGVFPSLCCLRLSLHPPFHLPCPRVERKTCKNLL